MQKKNKVLSKNNRVPKLFDRDVEGKLIPSRTYLLGSLEQEIMIIPLVRGELAKLTYDIEINHIDETYLREKIIKTHLIFPKFDNFHLIKPKTLNKIYNTILFESGVGLDNIDEIKEEKRKYEHKSETRKVYDLYLKTELKGEELNALHELGYTIKTIPILTLVESEMLIRIKQAKDIQLLKAKSGIL